MQRILICKQAASPIEAHIYEHLAMTKLKQIMQQFGLLRQIDYFALGTHYSGTGFITIDIDLYTEEAVNLAYDLRRLQALTDNESLNLAMSQIAAENDCTIICNNLDKLQYNIAKLNKNDWQSIEKIDQPLIISPLAEHKFLYETDDPITSISHISCALKQPLNSDVALLALFYYLAFAIHGTVSDIANVRLGYYTLSEHAERINKSTSCICEFAALSNLADRDKLRDIYHEVIGKMLEKAALARISRRIKSFSYNDGKMNVPNIDMYISEIGIVAGEKTWQKLAKEKTITNLLDKMILEIV